MIKLYIVILASICNAIMDKHSHHFHKSIFKNLKWKFFREDSWKNKYVDWDNGDKNRRKIWGFNYPVQLTDSFHFFKSIMLVLLLYPTYDTLTDNILLDWLIYGTTWNVVFTLFYHKLLEK